MSETHDSAVTHIFQQSADRESGVREEMTKGDEELYNDRRKMLVNQYPVQRLPESRHPTKNARKSTIEQDDTDGSAVEEDMDFVDEVSNTEGIKTDFFRYQYDLDIADWPQVKNAAEAAHLLGRTSEVALSRTRGVRWTKDQAGSVEYHLCLRPHPAVWKPFPDGRSLVQTLFACIKTWFRKASPVQNVRYAVLLEDSSTESLFWSTATEQGENLLDVVASHPELLASSLQALPATTIDSELPEVGMCGLYLLQGLKVDKPGLYIGQSNYLLRRWKEHFFEAHTPLTSTKSFSLVYQSLQEIRNRGGQISALPLSQLGADQHIKYACLFEIAWTMVFRSYQGSESYLEHAAGCGLPFLDIVGLNTDHGGGREYTNGNPLNGVNPSLDGIVWEMRSLHRRLLLAQSVTFLPSKYSAEEVSNAQQQIAQLRIVLEKQKSNFVKEKANLLQKGDLSILFGYYTTQRTMWMTGTFFGLNITEATLLSIFTKEDLRVAKIVRSAVVKARLVDAGIPAVASDFFLMMTKRQRACVGGISIIISNPATGKAIPWQQKSGLSHTAKLTRAFRFVSGMANDSAWRREEMARVFKSAPLALASLEGVAKRLWQGEQSCKKTGKSFLLNQVESDGETTSGWMLPKEQRLQESEVLGAGVFVQVVMESMHRVFRGLIYQNEEEELAIACLGFRFLSLQHGWIDIERAYTSGGGCLFEQCMAIWRIWFPQQTAVTKLRLQGKLPRGAVQEDDVQDLTEEPLLFQTFIGTCYDRNRILVPRNRFEDRKICRIAVPAAMAAAWSFCDGCLPKGSQWEVKIDAWGKTQENARILIRRITRGKYDNVWLDADEYRVSALSAFSISGQLWDECQKTNQALPQP